MQSQNSPQIEWDGQKTWAFLCLPMRFRDVRPTLRVCYDSAVLVARTNGISYFVGFASEDVVAFGVLPMELNNQGFVVPEEPLGEWEKKERLGTTSNGVDTVVVYKAFSHDGRPGIWLTVTGSNKWLNRVYPILFSQA